jgi:hypothetical protein
MENGILVIIMKKMYFGNLIMNAVNAHMKYVVLWLKDFICRYYIETIIGLRNQKWV